MALTPGPAIAPASSLAGNITQAMDTTPQLGQPDSPAVSMQNPYTVPQSPAPITDNRSFTQKLLGGLLAGAAGGAAADPTQSNGGILGLNNAHQQEQLYQQDLARRNQEQQRGFENQLQQLHEQRANSTQVEQDQLHSVQLAEANLHQLELAHELENRPFNEQVKHAEGVTKLIDSVEKAGGSYQLTEGTYSGVSDYLQQHPESLNQHNFMYIPGVNGGKGQVAVITTPPHYTADQQAKIAKDLGIPWSPGFTASDKGFLQLVSAAQLENVKQAGRVELKQTAKAGSGTGLSSGPAGDAEIEALHAGTAIPTSFIGGRGSGKQIQALTNSWLNKYPEDAPKVEKYREQAKFADNAQVNNTLAAGRTLFSNNGTFTQLDNLVRQIPRDQIPYINKWLQSGAYEGGDKNVAAVLSTMPDVAQELASFTSGVSGRGTDLKIKLAEDQLRKADTPEQWVNSLRALRELAIGRYVGIVGSRDEENRFLSSKYGIESYLPAGSRVGRKNGRVLGYTDAQGKWHDL